MKRPWLKIRPSAKMTMVAVMKPIRTKLADLVMNMAVSFSSAARVWTSFEAGVVGAGTAGYNKVKINVITLVNDLTDTMTILHDKPHTTKTSMIGFNFIAVIKACRSIRTIPILFTWTWTKINVPCVVLPGHFFILILGADFFVT